MRFADSDIKELFRELLTHRFKLVSLTHSGCDHRDFFICCHLIADRITSVLRVRREAVALFGDGFTITILKRWGGVEVHRVFSGGFVAVTFLRHHMQQDWTLHLTCHGEVLSHQADVMPINRSEIPNVEFFK